MALQKFGKDVRKDLLLELDEVVLLDCYLNIFTKNVFTIRLVETWFEDVDRA